MDNLNFLAGKNKDWLERNFEPILSNIYDIYDVMFDKDGKIIGAVRAEYSGGPPKQEKYPVKHSRYTYSLKLREFSILIEEPLNFMNWKDNPLR